MILILNWLIFIMTFGMISIAETTTDIITLDTPIAELNGLTLNELFIDNQLIVNGDFNDGTTNWIANAATHTVSSGILSNTGTGVSVSASSIHSIIPYSNFTFYNVFRGRVLQTANYVGINLRGSTTSGTVRFNYVNSPTVNQFVQQSVLTTFVGGAGNIQIRAEHNYPTTLTATGAVAEFDYVYLYNISALGLTSLTKSQLDDYYDLYMNGGYYEYDAILNDLDMTDFIIISSSFVLWLWFMRFMKGVL